MHRIDTANATAGNLFTEGDPVAGDLATEVSAAIMNALQEEVCAVVESIEALDKADNTQLLRAIQSLISAAPAFSTGDAKLTIKVVADAGWIMAADGTIGSAASGASTRANADCWLLFILLWNNFANAYAPVTGGRGASAQADWDAHKKIQVGTILGRAIAVAGNGSGLTGRALGQILGEEENFLPQSGMPLHAHNYTSIYNGGTNEIDGGGAAGAYRDPPANASTTTSAGGGQGHNNMQPTVFFNVMIKL